MISVSFLARFDRSLARSLLLLLRVFGVGLLVVLRTGLAQHGSDYLQPLCHQQIRRPHLLQGCMPINNLLHISHSPILITVTLVNP